MEHVNQWNMYKRHNYWQEGDKHDIGWLDPTAAAKLI